MPSWRDLRKKPARPAARSEARTDWTDTRPVDRPDTSSQASPPQQAPDEPTPQEPAEEPASQEQAPNPEPPAEKPADEPVAQQAENPAAQPAEQPEAQPAEKPTNKPAERPAKKEAPVAKTTEEKQEKEPRKGRDTGKKVVAGANALRARIASIVWLVAVIFAATLAIAALMTALKMNENNAVVSFILDVADKLYPFKNFKNYTGSSAHTKEILTNYGLMAVIYLVVGKVLDRIIRP